MNEARPSAKIFRTILLPGPLRTALRDAIDAIQYAKCQPKGRMDYNDAIQTPRLLGGATGLADRPFVFTYFHRKREPRVIWYLALAQEEIAEMAAGRTTRIGLYRCETTGCGFRSYQAGDPCPMCVTGRKSDPATQAAPRQPTPPRSELPAGPLELATVVAALPRYSPYRDILPGLMSEDQDRQVKALRTLFGEIRPPGSGRRPRPSDLAHTLLRAATELRFPTPRLEHRHPASALVFTLLGSGSPDISALVEERYARADGPLQASLLTLLASVGSPHAVQALTRLVVEHGWPEPWPPRLELELLRNLDQTSPFIAPLLAAPSTPTALVDRLESHRRNGGAQPRERVPSTARTADATLPTDRVVTGRERLGALEPRHAAGAGGASFPAEHRDRAAYAAADLVGLLERPARLGRAPDELELMEVFEGYHQGHFSTLWVWRFRLNDEPWRAGVSGPYRRDAPNVPQQGVHTSSSLERWEGATAQDHAAEALRDLIAWRVAWASHSGSLEH